MNMILADMQPVSVVEDDGFVRLIKQAWPKYELPSRKYFSDKLPVIYGLVRDAIKTRMPKDGWLSFGTDGWSSRNGEYSYESVTAYWLDDDFNLQSRVLDITEITGRHTGENLKNLFADMLESWSIIPGRVHTVVTDSGANIVKVRTLLGISG
jgi:hypothetical protein